MTDMPPMVKWTAAVIAGGGVAGLTRGSIGALRAHSTVLTGGLGNFVISTAELGGAALISFLALAAPIAAIALVALFLYVAMRLLRRLLRRQTIERPDVRRFPALTPASDSKFGNSVDSVFTCRKPEIPDTLSSLDDLTGLGGGWERNEVVLLT